MCNKRCVCPQGDAPLRVLCWGAGTMWPTFLAREKIQITPAGVGSAFPLRGKQTMEGNPEAKQNHQV